MIRETNSIFLRLSSILCGNIFEIIIHFYQIICGNFSLVIFVYIPIAINHDQSFSIKYSPKIILVSIEFTLVINFRH